MEPADEADLDKWYREEHLDMLHKLPGYRRSSRYILGPRTPVTEGDPPKYLAIHEMDELAGLDGKEAEAANNTPWSVKNIKESKAFVGRAWKLLYSQGF
jgi:hypothetical protein